MVSIMLAVITTFIVICGVILLADIIESCYLYNKKQAERRRLMEEQIALHERFLDAHQEMLSEAYSANLQSKQERDNWQK